MSRRKDMVNDIQKVTKKEIRLHFGMFHFELYTDNITDDTARMFIYIKDENEPMIIRDTMKGYKTIESAKKAIMRDIRAYSRDVREIAKSLSD